MAEVDRRRCTECKTVRLTPEFRERVQAWADGQSVSISSSLETLAMLGSGEAPQLAVMQAAESVVTSKHHSAYRMRRSGQR